MALIGTYWITEQIISKGLHLADEECKSYTMNLMDKLEQVIVGHFPFILVAIDMSERPN